jgi:putative drug exporter of the RND superfamily
MHWAASHSSTTQIGGCGISPASIASRKARPLVACTVLTAENLQQVTDMINDDISNLDDFIRPLKNYFYWEPHCFDIPICWAFRSPFDGLDGIDALDVEIAHIVTDLQAVDALLPQLTTQLKILRDDTQALQAVIVNSYGPAHLQSTQTDQTFDDLINVGNDFDKSRSDDFFYMPREAFDNEDVKTGMTLMMSPDGMAARFIVTHEGNAMGPEGVEHVEAFPQAIQIALKETSLAGARIYIGGAGSNNKDIKQYAADLLIVAIAAFILIFLIMLFITRSLMAALVIPGTVAFSFAGAFGLSILVWQHLIGLHLHWLVLPITFIILVAVGSDYNLLLIARVKEELGAGIHTGLIRALGSTGGVVTSAGLVFAFTMLALLTSDLRTIGQVGTTVCIGLLLDTLIVRSFIVPCILRILGPWFWWPTLVRTRPLRQPSDFAVKQ